MKVVQINKEDIGGYGCNSCWLDNQQDVNAVVIVEDTYGILNNPKHTALCGNHAEVLTDNQTEGK